MDAPQRNNLTINKTLIYDELKRHNLSKISVFVSPRIEEKKIRSPSRVQMVLVVVASFCSNKEVKNHTPHVCSTFQISKKQHNPPTPQVFLLHVARR